MLRGLLSIALLWVGSPVDAAPRLGQAAPPFSLRTPRGELLSLQDLHRKGPVILDFFRTDCRPCYRALPMLKRLHEQHQAKGLTVVLIALLEEQAGLDKLEQFLRGAKLPFVVLIDGYALVANKYVRQRDSYRLPGLFVVDRAGVLRAGPALSAKQLAQLLGDLLKSPR